jgi:hypothetical protein
MGSRNFPLLLSRSGQQERENMTMIAKVGKYILKICEISNRRTYFWLTIQVRNWLKIRP